MSETLDDQLSRLNLMAGGDPTWDLSASDCLAIGAALDRIAELERQVAAISGDRNSLVKLIGVFTAVYSDVAQVFDGWHCDEAWSEYDEQVRQRMVEAIGMVEALAAIAPPASEEALRDRIDRDVDEAMAAIPWPVEGAGDAPESDEKENDRG